MSKQPINVYYKRKTGTAKPCWVCRKDTTTCLATIDVADFIYSCDTHLSDRSFVQPIADPAPAPPSSSSVSAADIERVKAEYEAKQATKAAKASGGDKDKADKPAASTSWFSSIASVASAVTPSASAKPVTPPTTPPAAAPTKFRLTSSFWTTRQNELKMRAAREATKSLPSAAGLPALR